MQWTSARVHLKTATGTNGNLHHGVKYHPVSAVNAHTTPSAPEGSPA